MRRRPETVGHPFATMTMRMGATHVLTKTLSKFASEMALCRYCISAPTFRTSHPKYAWLAATLAIGKFIESKHGQSSYIKYDVFAVK